MTTSPSRLGLVTDSNSQITDDLIERFDVEVVPLTITIDGVDHLEGRGDGLLDADAFYAHFADGAVPEISTGAPAPGRFADAYQRLADRGCEEIVSVHLAASMSGTIASATVAARSAPVPVEVVDTGSASFGVAACTWAAGAAIAGGATTREVIERITALAPRIGTAFMIGVPLLTARGGRARDVDLDDDRVPVLAMSEGTVEVLDRVSTAADTIDVMAGYASARARTDTVTVAIGTADEPSRPLADRLATALDGAAGIDGVVHYRVGASVGAHTGPGTFGLFAFPTLTP